MSTTQNDIVNSILEAMKSGQGYNSSAGRSLMFLNAVNKKEPYSIR
jgi:hypothetical protein